jgi:hypothetical protein
MAIVPAPIQMIDPLDRGLRLFGGRATAKWITDDTDDTDGHGLFSFIVARPVHGELSLRKWDTD